MLCEVCRAWLPATEAELRHGGQPLRQREKGGLYEYVQRVSYSYYSSSNKGRLGIGGFSEGQKKGEMIDKHFYMLLYYVVRYLRGKYIMVDLLN